MRSFFIWMTEHQGWKVMCAVTYVVICIFDFILVPTWFGLARATGSYDSLSQIMQIFESLDTSVQLEILKSMTYQHEPFTLKGGGLLHLSFGALLTGSAVSRFKNGTSADRRTP